MAKTFQMKPEFKRKLAALEREAHTIASASNQAFANGEYERAYALAAEAERSWACYRAVFNKYRGWQETGIKEEAWVR